VVDFLTGFITARPTSTTTTMTTTIDGNCPTGFLFFSFLYALLIYSISYVDHLNSNNDDRGLQTTITMTHMINIINTLTNPSTHRNRDGSNSSSRGLRRGRSRLSCWYVLFLVFDFLLLR
jgi:hypothetical protein